jgi:hypothetical protein
MLAARWPAISEPANQPVFSSDGNGSDGVFYWVVVDGALGAGRWALAAGRWPLSA